MSKNEADFSSQDMLTMKHISNPSNPNHSSDPEIQAQQFIAKGVGESLLKLVGKGEISKATEYAADPEHRKTCIELITAFISQVEIEVTPAIRNYQRFKGPGRQTFKNRILRASVMIHFAEMMRTYLSEWTEGAELRPINEEELRKTIQRIETTK